MLRTASPRLAIRSRLGPISTAFHGWPQVGGGLLAGPEGEAVVVLRGEHDVFGTGTREDVCPMPGVEELGTELRREALIGKAGAESFLMKVPSAGFHAICLRVVAALSHLVPVPLGVGQLAGNDGCVGGDRVDPPMNDDAEFCLGVPLRRGPLVHGIPGRLVGLRVQTTQQQGEQKKVFHSQPFSGGLGSGRGFASGVGDRNSQSSLQKGEYIFREALQSTLK